jgi:hypothetical protein
VVASGYAIAFGAVPGTQASKIAIVSPQTIFVAPRPARQLVSLSAAAIGNGERAHEQHGKIQEEEEADEEQDAAARSFFSLNATTVVIARL